jgi:hypothetical protein
MAAGAAMVAMGVKSGAIEIGANLLGTHNPLMNTGTMVGTATGIGFGAWVGAMLGSIGVAAAGTAIGIPAIVVIGGAAVIFGLAGYTLGDLANNFLTPSLDIATLVGGGSLLVAGTYLLIKGARRILSHQNLKSALLNKVSDIREGLIILPSLTAEVIAHTKEELASFATELMTLPETKVEAALTSASTVALGAVGVVASGSVATGSITVFGSSALGGYALSLGLISAPIWPVIAGGLLAGGVGYTAIKAVKHLRTRSKV